MNNTMNNIDIKGKNDKEGIFKCFKRNGTNALAGMMVLGMLYTGNANAFVHNTNIPSNKEAIIQLASVKRNVYKEASASGIVFTPNNNLGKKSQKDVSALLSNKELSNWMINKTRKLISEGKVLGVGGGVPLYYQPVGGNIEVSGKKYTLTISATASSWKLGIPYVGTEQEFTMSYSSGNSSDTASNYASGNINLFKCKFPGLEPIIYAVIVSPQSSSNQTQPLVQSDPSFAFNFFGQNVMQNILSNLENAVTGQIDAATSNYIGSMLNNTLGINQSTYSFNNVNIGEPQKEKGTRHDGIILTYIFKNNKDGSAVKFNIPVYCIKEYVSRDGGLHMTIKETPFVAMPRFSR